MDLSTWGAWRGASGAVATQGRGTCWRRGEPRRQGAAAAIEDAEPGAAELPLAAEKQREARRENEAEAERIAEEAQRQARELLEEAELEAKESSLLAGRELARNVRTSSSRSVQP